MLSFTKKWILFIAFMMAFLLVGSVYSIDDEVQDASANKPVVLTYDQDNCLESCDIQYDRCTKKNPNNPDHIKYCSDQHDSCRRKCLEDR